MLDQGAEAPRVDMHLAVNSHDGRSARRHAWLERRDGECEVSAARRSCSRTSSVCIGTEANSYLRRIDSCISQLKIQGPSRTCNERFKKKKKSSVAQSRDQSRALPPLEGSTLVPNTDSFNQELQVVVASP